MEKMNEILKDYPEYLHIWEMADGTEIHVRDMEEGYIRNILELQRNGKIVLMTDQIKMFEEILEEV